MKKLLVVVDYQNDFVNGSLGFENADVIEPNIIALIEKFEKNHDFICFTKDTHSNDYLQTEEGKKLPITHCVKGTYGWEFTDKVKAKTSYYPVFEKTTFPSLDLANFIRGNSLMIDEIYLCGLVSDICVFTNAIMAKSAARKDCKIFVVKEATSSNNLAVQEKCFEMLEHLHIEVI